MPNPDLQNYITQSRQQGMTDDQIRQNLVGQGWTEKDISENLILKSAGYTTASIILVVLGWLLVPVVLFVALMVSAFNDAGPAFYSYLVMFIGLFYPIALLIFSIRLRRHRSLLPIIFLIALYFLPLLLAVRDSIIRNQNYKDTLAKNNAPLIQKISMDNRDFVCTDPTSDEKFIYINKTESKIEQITIVKKTELYMINPIGIIDSSDNISLTTRWSGLKDCRDKNNLNIFETYSIKNTN